MQWRPWVTTLEEGLEVLGGEDDTALLDQGLAASPELDALDSAVSAQRRAFAAAQRVFYAPTVGLSADISQILAKDEGGGPDLGGD